MTQFDRKELISWLEIRYKDTPMPGAKRMFRLALEAVREQPANEPSTDLIHRDEFRCRAESWADNIFADEPDNFKYNSLLDLIDESETVEFPDNEPLTRCEECVKYQTRDCAAKHEQALTDFCSHGISKPEGSEDQ